MFFNMHIMLVSFVSYICFLFGVYRAIVLFCVLFILLYTAVSLPFLYKFTDRCHTLENQLHYINIISYAQNLMCAGCVPSTLTALSSPRLRYRMSVKEYWYFTFK